MSIDGKLKYNKLDLKRLYLPGLKLSGTCPHSHCKADYSQDLEYLYPYSVKEDGSCSISFCCSSCEEVIDLSMKLEISLKSN